MDERLVAFKRLLDIMDKLRAECPWDKKQTLESLRYLTIEETYELSDAILEKDMDGLIHRHINLCISCKSCVTICPFGTMMTDFFVHHRDKDLYFDLSDQH